MCNDQIKIVFMLAICILLCKNQSNELFSVLFKKNNSHINTCIFCIYSEEPEIRAAFESFGPIKEIKLQKDTMTGIVYH